MDDTRTRKTLEALADVFLTGASPGTPPPPQPERKPAEPPLSAQLDAPRPIRLPPKTSPAMRSYDSTGPTPQPRLKLHGSAAVQSEDDQAGEGHAAPAPRPPAVVEAVILGNLPGFGGPWLTQYAYHLSATAGPVAVLHVLPDNLEVELVTPLDAQEGEHIAAAAEETGRDVTVLDTLEAMAEGDPTPVSRWLIHVVDPLSPHGLGWVQQVPRWTLLCGSDDAANVAAYRTLKQLLECSRRPQDVGVMIMGSDEVRSTDAARKLHATTNQFLHTPVRFVGHQRQMVPVNLRELGSFDAESGDASFWPGVQRFLRELASERPATTGRPAAEAPAATMASTASAPPVPTVAPAVSPTLDQALEDLDDEEMLELEPAAASTGERKTPRQEEPNLAAALAEVLQRESRSAAPPRPVEPVASAAVSPLAVPTPGAVDSPNACAAEPDLCELLTAQGAALAGAVALQARCPRQPATRLLLDQSGRLHLLRRDEGAAGDALRAAVLDLVEARAWVREHLEIIRLTQRQCTIDAAEPSLHLFTSDAKLAVALAGRLGAFVTIHLLQRVTAGGATRWLCTDLN